MSARTGARWLNAANPLTKTLAPCILGAALNSPAYSRNIVTAARQCPSVRLLMVINDNDWPRTVPVEFTPYQTGRPIVRYRIGYDGIATDLIPNSRGDSINLAAGESAVYLFPLDDAQRFVSGVGVAPPSAPGGAKRAILHYGYIYKEALVAAFTGTAEVCRLSSAPPCADRSPEATYSLAPHRARVNARSVPLSSLSSAAVLS